MSRIPQAFPSPPPPSTAPSPRAFIPWLNVILISAAFLAGATGSPVHAQATLPLVSVIATELQASEEGLKGAVVQFQRAGDLLDADLTVSFDVSGGLTQGGLTAGATHLSDFNLDPACPAPPCQVTIPSGQAAATVSVQVIQDTADEPIELIVFTISPNAAYTVAPINPANVAILDDDLATVSVVASDATADEAGPETGAFTLLLNAPTPHNLPVRYSLDPLSGATLGADYTFGPTPQPGVVVIPAGANQAEITILPNDDTVPESSEPVTINLETSPLYALGAPSSATVTIVDDDAPSVALLPLDTEADEEGTATATLILSRGPANGAPALPVSITFSSAPGDATLGTDYQTDPPCPSSPCTLTIGAGEPTLTLTITPLADAGVESTEPILVSLTAGPGYAVGTPDSATVRLLDDDLPVVGVTAFDDAASEPGSNTGTYRLTRSGPTASELRVFLSVASTSTALEGQDYEPLGRSVSIPIGSATADLILTVNDDVTDEPPETVVLNLALPPAGDATYSIDALAAGATVNIADNDIPTLGVVAATPATLEGSTNAAVIQVIRLSGNLTLPLTVEYALTGTADLGTDYTVAPACCTVDIPADVRSATITITSSVDSSKESIETVHVSLTASNAYNILSPFLSATSRIVDEDVPSVSVSATDAAGDENGGNSGAFTVTRTGETSAPLVVHYAVGGTAEPVDYAPLAGHVTIPAGGASATILVTPINDPFAESSETVTVTLTATLPHYLVAGGAATVTLVDSDRPLAVIVATPIANEVGPVPGRFVVARLLAEDLSLPLDVDYTIQGTAAPADYVAAPLLTGIIRIPAEASSVEIIITPNDDATKESAETLVLTLSTDAAYSTLGGTNSATLRIVSDDP